MGLNPSAVYWMDIFHIDLLKKLYRCLFEKTENKRKSGGVAIFLNGENSVFLQLLNTLPKGSGCGSIVITIFSSYTRGLWFKSSHQQNFIMNIFNVYYII